MASGTEEEETGQDCRIKSLMYGNFSDAYAKLTPPVPMIRFIRFRHLLMQDVHSEKWFNRTDAANWIEFEWDELEPVAKQMEVSRLRHQRSYCLR
ncbi:unnamed protein product [Symbiodinium natans]|uniref:Uncharacterized protein n=1 Tax=Symbiodinium natans TaxID=878477 RepID=A0A812NHE3_9DINO|nr:unnamed protein product [Symbiodinium natans]